MNNEKYEYINTNILYVISYFCYNNVKYLFIGKYNIAFHFV